MSDNMGNESINGKLYFQALSLELKFNDVELETFIYHEEKSIIVTY